MASNSMQHKLDTVRPPRVQITYDVETGGATEQVDLPFVMGIIADMGAQLLDDGKTPVPLKDRDFNEIDRDNFNKTMRSISPNAQYSVDSTVPDTMESLTGITSGNPAKISVDLTFKQMDDFDPVNVVDNVPELKSLLDQRNALRDLQSKLDSVNGLDDDLNKIDDTDSNVAIQKAVDDIAPSPASQDYANEMVKAFAAVKEEYGDSFKSVQLLFSIDDSDTFNTADVATGLSANGDDAVAVPDSLGLEFTKAGYPLTSAATIESYDDGYGDTTWQISDIPAGDESGTGLLGTTDGSGNTNLTFTPAPANDDYEGLSLLMTGPGKLAGKTYQIQTYSSEVGATFTPVMPTAAVTADSKVTITDTEGNKLESQAISSISGKVLTVTIEDPLSSDKLVGGTLEIVSGPGTGMSDTIAVAAVNGTDNTKHDLTSTTVDWSADFAADGDTFTYPAPMIYTVKEESGHFDIYQDSDDATWIIQYRIGQLDEVLSAQLSAVMHDSDFQQMEAKWRGLHDLVYNSETGTELILRLLNVPRDMLQSDLDNAVEFDQSQLFKKVYEAEYGVFGGSPYSCLLGDFEFGRNPQDVKLLQEISGVAAAAHAPFIAAAAPDLFDLSSYTDLDKPRDLEQLFESAELIKWRSFRDTEDSRYVTLTLPHTMMRLPYGPDTNPVDDFNFVETADSHDDFVWGNSAWDLAQCITNAFALYGWTAAIRGYEGGGLVSDLPVYSYTTDSGALVTRIPTEIAITDRREFELSNLGFIALCYRKNTDEAAFFGGQTTNKPKVYIQDDATANARLSSTLPYMLSASRFAHYIKVMMRDRIGSFMTADQISQLLNQWISQYVLINDNAGQETKARYPLREARIDVVADPSKPGYYNAVVFLRPHYQLEELTVSIRLVAELPAPAGG